MLQLVADGKSNKDIGEELGLSALTVKSHLARIARKLGTGDRAEMVARRCAPASSPDARSRLRRTADSGGLGRVKGRTTLASGGPHVHRRAQPEAAEAAGGRRESVPSPLDRPSGRRSAGSPRTLAALAAAVDALAAGSGPVAVDAERASGHRYGQRAFLVQLRRSGAAPRSRPGRLPGSHPVGDAHRRHRVGAARGDPGPALPRRGGLRPTRLFDTELGARFAGLPAGRASAPWSRSCSA